MERRYQSSKRFTTWECPKHLDPSRRLLQRILIQTAALELMVAIGRVNLICQVALLISVRVEKKWNVVGISHTRRVSRKSEARSQKLGSFVLGSFVFIWNSGLNKAIYRRNFNFKQTICF
jgi:hypothetical protein